MAENACLPYAPTDWTLTICTSGVVVGGDTCLDSCVFINGVDSRGGVEMDWGLDGCSSPATSGGRDSAPRLGVVGRVLSSLSWSVCSSTLMSFVSPCWVDVGGLVTRSFVGL